LEVLGNTAEPSLLGIRGLIEQNRSNLLGDLGDYDSALAGAERAVAIWERLVPDEPRRADDLANSLKACGGYRLRSGCYAEAIAAYEKASRWYERVVEKDPTREVAEERGKILIAVGTAQSRVGNLASAKAAILAGMHFFASRPPSAAATEAGIEDYLTRQLVRLDEVASMQPSQVAQWRKAAQDGADTAGELGRSGAVQQGIEVLADALVIRDRIAEVAPSIDNLADRARACLQMTVMRLHRGHLPAALTTSSRAIADLEQGLSAGDVRLLPEWGKARYALATVLRMQGREDDARRCIEEVLKRRAPGATADWKNVVAMADDFLHEERNH
jgi:tetratricopeptide (TPR) repeat protein